MVVLPIPEQPNIFPSRLTLEGEPTRVGTDTMPPEAQPHKLREVVTHLQQLADEWEELLRNHVAMVQEFQAAKDKLDQAFREFTTLRADYEKLLNQRDQMLATLNSLLFSYRKRPFGEPPDRSSA